MKNYYKQIRLAEKFGKYFLDKSSTSEKEDFEKWLKDNEEHKETYEGIINEEKIRGSISQFESYDANSALERVQKRIENKGEIRRLRVHSLLRYAAVIAIPILMAGLVYYWVDSQPQKVQVSEIAHVQPGGSKALLYLADGSLVELEKSKEIMIHESDGTQIGLTQKQLTYSVSDSLPQIKREHYNVIITPRGGEYHLVLADGTQVWLNADSRLKYPVQFIGKQRCVELEGEAYFEVAKNANKPFIVSTRATEIKVLGTSFNVMAYADEEAIETTLVEGAVRLNSKQSPNTLLLKPGYKAGLFKNKAGFQVKEVDTSIYTAWKDGRFVFENEPLESIMRKIARWYDVKVFYQNPDAKDLRFTARLKRYEDIEGLLEIIEMTQKVKIEIKGDALVIHKIE